MLDLLFNEIYKYKKIAKNIELTIVSAIIYLKNI